MYWFGILLSIPLYWFASVKIQLPLDQGNRLGDVSTRTNNHQHKHKHKLLKTEWKARTLHEEDIRDTLETAFRIMLPQEEEEEEEEEEEVEEAPGWALLDVGCGEGAVLKVPIQFNNNKIDKVGIELVPAFAAVARRENPGATILTQNIMKFTDTDMWYITNALAGNPTVAYIYDGGIFPTELLKHILTILDILLPPGSVIVFLTAVASGRYSAEQLRHEVEKTRFRFVGSRPQLREQNAKRGTMQALFFAGGEGAISTTSMLTMDLEDDEDARFTQEEREALDDVLSPYT